MGSTGVMTKQSFMDVLKMEYATAYAENKILKVIEMRIPMNHLDPDYSEESDFFLAVRRSNGAIGCNVILFHRFRDKSEVIYKEMDEGMGPYSCFKCPKEIMDMLSPIEQLEYPGYAKEWRERQV